MSAPCGPCGTKSAVTDASAPLVNNFAGSNYSPVLTTLLRALDQVEMRMRFEPMKVSWKPSMFPQRDVPYGRKPEGTEVVVQNTPIYFEENDPYVYNLRTPGPEGGICEGHSLCEEPPANKIPGDTYQQFSWTMTGTAWETPVFCLKDLLFYENGPETLRRFLDNVEKTPMNFYDSYIRNLVWDTGEKYILAATDVGLLWNSADRVSKREAPNLLDFKSFAPAAANADAAAPTLAAIQQLKYILKQFLGDATPLNVEGQRDMMMVGVEPDIFSFVYHDDQAGAPVSFVEGGMGFNPFSFAIINQLPFAVKLDDYWYRGDFDANGEFQRIPAKVYVEQNGGLALRPNFEWLTAKYGVLTFMTARPFIYRTFGNLPNMPSNVPEESTRFLRPRFQFAPLTEKCSYTRGLVAWRAEDEFGFQPTGEDIIHVIYRRDELASFLRQAKEGADIQEIQTNRTPIPTTCPDPQVLSCCATPGDPDIGGVDYRDTTYSVTYQGDIIGALGIDVSTDLPAAAQFQTEKGVFDVAITHVNTAGDMITFGVDPTQHEGGHFCCEDQLVGFVLSAPVDQCSAQLFGGLAPDPFDSTLFHGNLSAPLNTTAAELVSVFFDGGCGTGDIVTFTVISVDNARNRIVLSVTGAEAATAFADGVPCEDAVSICANNTAGCEDCLPQIPATCVPDSVTPVPMGMEASDELVSEELVEDTSEEDSE